MLAIEENAVKKTLLQATHYFEKTVSLSHQIWDSSSLGLRSAITSKHTAMYLKPSDIEQKALLLSKSMKLALSEITVHLQRSQPI